MIPRYRGKLGEYMWQKEMERLNRYKDRPWELQARAQSGGELIVLMIVIGVAFGGLILLSLFD